MTETASRVEKKVCVSCFGDKTVHGIKKVTWRGVPVPKTDYDTVIECATCKGKGYTNHAVMVGERLCGCFEGTTNATAKIHTNRCREFFGHLPLPLSKDCRYCEGSGRISETA
jgi:hypothetical protein